MEQDIKVLKVINMGFEKCEHSFIYNNPLKMGFSFPPIVHQERICKHCGQMELVESNRARKFNEKKVDEIFMKFNKEDGE